MNETEVHTLVARFFAIVKLAEKLEKTPRCFGTAEPLTPSEIHLVEMTGDHDETLSVTDLSKWIGVTKGAVSQNLKKLEKKGFVTKIEDPANSSRSIVKLTTKGKTAYYAHKHWHETMDGGFHEYFNNLSPAKVAFMHEFMSKLETFLKRAMQ